MGPRVSVHVEQWRPRDGGGAAGLREVVIEGGSAGGGEAVAIKLRYYLDADGRGYHYDVVVGE